MGFKPLSHQANLLAPTENKATYWLTTNTDVITAQSHSLFACSREKIANLGFEINFLRSKIKD